MAFYKAKVKEEVGENPKGGTKYATKNYIVEGLSVEEATGKIHNHFKDFTYDWELVGVDAIKIEEVILN
jgi:hypothetical protein